MFTELKLLNEKFIEIKNKKWIKEKGSGTNKIGITFEQALGKEIENFPIPDFYNIEIKTMHCNSKHDLHLFNLNPDGDFLFPINRILEKLGYVTKNSLGKRILYKTFNAKNYSILPFYNKGKLEVDWENEKIRLIAFNSKNEEIELNISWSFDYLQKSLEQKLRYLAIIRASSRIIENEGYFYYYQINYYQLKDFDTFIRLIDEGIINITFSLGIFKSGQRTGQTYNHGTNFSLDIKNINMLYTEIKL